jgi:hypothetical protein
VTFASVLLGALSATVDARVMNEEVMEMPILVAYAPAGSGPEG